MKKTNKLLALVLSVILIVSVIPLSTFSAFAETEYPFLYSVANGKATITGLVNHDYYGTVDIPSTIGGYPVISIGDDAFYCYSRIKSVIMPDTVISIGRYAFGECYELTNVSFSKALTEIGYNAFRRCKLTEIDIPESVTNISGDAFYGCDLESITVDSNNPVYYSCDNCLIERDIKTLVLGCKNSIIPSDGSVISIGMGAFSACSGLKSIVIPSPIKTINSLAFDCCGITSITIGASVSEINNWSFGSCRSLEEIIVESGNTTYHSEGNCLIDTANKELVAGCNHSVIPTDGSVTAIGDWAFWNREGLTSIKIPSNITFIGAGAFNGCSALTSIKIPDSVIWIGSEAFQYCKRLKNVEIPNRLNSIEDETFYRCTALTSVRIPKSVQYIGRLAFSECRKLKDVYYAGTEEQKSKMFISTEEGLNYYEDANYYLVNATWHYVDESKTDGIFKYSASNGKATITGLAEDYYGALKIPSTLGGYPVAAIGDWAFENCIGVTNVIIPNGVSCIGRYAFSFCTKLERITIPDSVMSINDEVCFCCNSLTDIYYTGTEQQKNQITISANYNEDLLNVPWHYNYEPSCFHEKTMLKKAKAATCNEAGYTGDTYCSDCGEKLAGGVQTAALGHNYKAVVTEPTCTAKGYTTHTCSRCGDCYVDTYVNALGHTGGTATCCKKAVCTRCKKEYGSLNASNHSGGTEVKNAKAATEEAAGYTGDTYCKGCGKKLSTGKSIAAKGVTYKITYKLDVGKDPKNPTTYTYATPTITLKSPTKNGYSFKGWYNGSKKVTEITKGSKGNITLTAKWSKITYKITYKLAGGKNVKNPAGYTVTTSTIKLQDPTKKGYTFKGWYNGSKKVTEIKKGSTGDITLTAKWEIITYKITYKLAGGKAVKNPTSYKVITSTITLKNPTKKGYTFKGWYSGSKKVTKITKGSTGNITLTAKWKKK